MKHRKAIVASGDPIVSEAAIQVIMQGGNAYDAIIAAGFVSTIAEPTLTSLGGGGFLMARTADGSTVLFDFFTDTPGKGLPEKDLDEWEAAIDEYEAQQGSEELPEDEENEWF